MRRNAVAWAALIVSSAALISSSGVLRTAPAAPQIDEQSQKVARSLSESFERVADFVKPSVVSIETQRKVTRGANPFGPRGNGNGGAVPKNVDPKQFEDLLKKFFEGEVPQFENQQFGVAQGTGSGFVFDDKGHIVTNNHVVANADKIVVTFHDGEEAVAKVVGADPKTDVAVIKVENHSYRPALRGKSESLKVGEWVLAVGSPFGFDQSVTAGIVSAMGRGDAGIIGARDAYEDFIQTDAAINPGNSGGPLVDLNGRVVGINAAIATSSRSYSGVGFAIPISLAEHIAEQLIKDGKVHRAAIGIALQPLTPAMAKQFGLDSKTKGVLVGSVLDDSPAKKAGLLAGDVIVGFDDHAAISVPSFRNLVSTSEVDRKHTLTYYRDGKKLTADITLAPAEKVLTRFDEAAKPEEKKEVEKKPEVKVEMKDFGIELQDLTADLVKSFSFPKDQKGVLISKVADGSVAQANGLREGMVITKVVRGGKITPVTSAKQLTELSGSAEEVTFYVQDKDVGRFITLSRAK